MTIKYSKLSQIIPNGGKIDQMAIKYTNIFHCKTLQNLPKLRFLVWIYTIWQPCCVQVLFPLKRWLSRFLNGLESLSRSEWVTFFFDGEIVKIQIYLESIFSACQATHSQCQLWNDSFILAGLSCFAKTVCRACGWNYKIGSTCD
jgi:hypothetical protein